MLDLVNLMSTLVGTGAGIVAILVGVRALHKGRTSEETEGNKDGKT